MLPLIIPALIAAASSAASGIAGAVQQGDAAKANAANAAADRAAQLKIVKMQLAAQAADQLKNQQQAAQQGLAGLYQQKASTAQDIAQRQTAANDDAMNSISRAYLQRH